MKLDEAIRYIKEQGYSITSARKDIIKYLIAKEGPATGPEILEQVAQNMDESTMYRNLQFLEKIELISSLKLEKRGVHYELNSKHHHHHIYCYSCGKILCLDICALGDIIKDLSKKTGFKDIHHHLEFSGRCHSCQ